MLLLNSCFGTLWWDGCVLSARNPRDIKTISSLMSRLIISIPAGSLVLSVAKYWKLERVCDNTWNLFHIKIVLINHRYFQIIGNIITELDEKIAEVMFKDVFMNWVCKVCNKMSKTKRNIETHIEANHIESSGVACPICYRVLKTRESLRSHMKNTKH